MGKKNSLVNIEYIIFILIMIIMFFSTQTYFGTANYPRVYRIAQISIVAFLLISIAYNRGVLKLKRAEYFSYRVVLLPNLVTFALSFAYYTFFHKITLSNLIYYNVTPVFLAVMAIVVYNQLQEKALRGIILAAGINYSIYVVTCIIKYGPLSLLTAGTDTEASRLLEVHEITFVFGLVAVFLLMSGVLKDKPIKKRWIFLALMYCWFGLKRILLAAIFISLVLYFLIKKKKKATIISIISVVLVLISIGWIYLCSSWETITGLGVFLNTDLKGRNWIYSNFYPYYEFSMHYWGTGIGYVQQLIGELSTMILRGHSIGLHNDFLRLYIELGFWPYIVYWWGILIYASRKISRLKSMDAAIKYFVMWVMTFVCIATDNLLTYPNYMITFYILILTCINDEGLTRGSKLV